MQVWFSSICITHLLFILTGEKFGISPEKITITNEEGAEIDSTEVIRDNDRLFIAQNEDFIWKDAYE